MVTAGVATAGVGHGTSLLLPSASSAEQGTSAEGLFAKNMGELIASSTDAKTQLVGEQVGAGSEKSDVIGTNESAEKKKLDPQSDGSPLLALSCTAATSVPVAFLAEGVHVVQMPRVSGQPVKEESVETQTQNGAEKLVADNSSAKNAVDQNVSIEATKSQQRPVVVSNPAVIATVSQVSASEAAIPKQASLGDKLKTPERKAEAKRESKKQVDTLPDVAVNTGVAGVDITATQTAIVAATLSPLSVETPKVETGVASMPSALVGSVGKVNQQPKGIVDGGSHDQAPRGRETIASAGLESPAAPHDAATHSQVTQASKESAVPFAVGAKAEEPGAVTAASSVAIGGSMQDAVQQVASGTKNGAGLTGNAVTAAVIQSQSMSGGDSLPVNDGHGMIAATSTSLEVGVANGSHGWLKIRAELTDGGAVSASLSATSSSGQEMLHRELPSLTAYLQSERLDVSTVVVHAASATQETADFSGALGGEQRSQMQQGAQDHSGDAREGLVVPDSEGIDEAGAIPGLEGGAAGTLSAAVYGEGGLGGGGWLSVMA